MRETIFKISAVVLCVILIAIFVSLILNLITLKLFWMLIIVFAAIAYLIFPRIRESLKKEKEED